MFEAPELAPDDLRRMSEAPGEFAGVRHQPRAGVERGEDLTPDLGSPEDEINDTVHGSILNVIRFGSPTQVCSAGELPLTPDSRR